MRSAFVKPLVSSKVSVRVDISFFKVRDIWCGRTENAHDDLVAFERIKKQPIATRGTTCIGANGWRVNHLLISVLRWCSLTGALPKNTQNNDGVSLCLQWPASPVLHTSNSLSGSLSCPVPFYTELTVPKEDRVIKTPMQYQAFNITGPS